LVNTISAYFAATRIPAPQRAALPARRHVQRPGHLEPLAAVVDRLGVKPQAAVRIPAQFPVLPQRAQHVEEFVGAFVAGLAVQVLRQAVVEGEVVDHRGDGVVAGPAVRGLVQRRQQPGQVVRIVERRRCRRDQPDVAGVRGDGSQRGDRFGRAAVERG
jgi:hypothetical protein